MNKVTNWTLSIKEHEPCEIDHRFDQIPMCLICNKGPLGQPCFECKRDDPEDAERIVQWDRCTSIGTTLLLIRNRQSRAGPTASFGGLPIPILGMILDYVFIAETIQDAEPLCPIVDMSCGHMWHVCCMTRWLKKLQECPICQVPYPDILDEDIRYVMRTRFTRRLIGVHH